MMLLLLAACGTSTETTSGTPEVTLDFTTGTVLDPKLEGAPVLRMSVLVTPFRDPDCAAVVTISNPAGQARTLLVALDAGNVQVGLAIWDGRDDTGTPFDPGEVGYVATATCADGARASTTASGAVVRLGIATLDFVDQPEDAPNIPLAYHKIDVATPGITVIDAATPEYRAAPGAAWSDLDDASGEPLPTPTPFLSADVPPWGREDPASLAYNVPAAYPAGARARLEVMPGTTAVSVRTGGPFPALGDPALGGPVIRAVPDGLTAVGDGRWAVGTPVRFDSAALDDTLGRTELAVTWRWEAQAGEEWVAIPGSVTTTHRIYRTAGEPALRDGAGLGYAPPIPWIGTLEDLAPVLEGLPPDDAAVLDAVHDWLYENPWLVYDPSDGSYSGYEGPYIYWDYSWSELTGWLDRSDGTHLYCHSMSCLLSVLVGTEGVSAPQQVLGVGFTTNLVRAAGSESWSRWGFNSHSVVSPDGGATIWDAAIDLDGDEDPSNEPVSPLTAKGIPQEEYFWRLTYDPITIVNDGLCYVR